MKYRFWRAVPRIIAVFSACLALNACSYFKNTKPSIDNLLLIDDHHYYAQRIYLDSESEISTLELNSNYSWIDQFAENRYQSDEEEAVQTAYTLLLHDQVTQAKNVLLRILANNNDNEAAKILLSSIESEVTATLSGKTTIELTRVRLGESWQSLAQKIFGSPLHFYRLVRLNHGKAALALKPGQRIKIPRGSAALNSETKPFTDDALSHLPLPANNLDSVGNLLNP